jgi:hypothetical protein
MRTILIASLFLLPISAFAATAVHHPNHPAARVRPHPLHHMRMSAGTAVHHPAIVQHAAAATSIVKPMMVAAPGTASRHHQTQIFSNQSLPDERE